MNTGTLVTSLVMAAVVVVLARNVLLLLTVGLIMVTWIKRVDFFGLLNKSTAKKLAGQTY